LAFGTSREVACIQPASGRALPGTDTVGDVVIGLDRQLHRELPGPDDPGARRSSTSNAGGHMRNAQHRRDLRIGVYILFTWVHHIFEVGKSDGTRSKRWLGSNVSVTEL
jgi:hypothetical protein